MKIEEIEIQEYTGSSIRPTPEIKDGETTLEKDVDYTLTYANNVNMGTNTASITITANENTNYTGSKTIYFSIKMNSTEEFVITLIDSEGNIVSDETYYYDGNAKVPSITVVQGSRTLRAGTDYEVSYENNIDAGDAKITITLIGFYTGE